MQKPAVLNLIFNGVGLLLGLTLVLYIVHSAFVTETTAPCRERYPAPTRFALQTPAGSLLTPIELQARVGLPEWGLTENARIVAEGPAGAALETKLAQVPDAGPDALRPNGVNFRWRPSGVQQASAACLIYSVWVPEGFPFNDGGFLPGVYGGDQSVANAPNPAGFGSRIKWRLDGVAELEAAGTGSTFVTLNQRGARMPPGQWMDVQQEVVLNTSGQADGVARLWVNGALVAEDAGLTLRKEAGETFAGVLADIGYLREPANAGILRFSPFEMAWR